MYCTGSIPVAPYHGGNDGKRRRIYTDKDRIYVDIDGIYVNMYGLYKNELFHTQKIYIGNIG